MVVHTTLGHDVTLVDLTRGESSSNGTPEERAREADEAARILGCDRRLNVGLPDAGIQSESPEQQRRVVEVIRSARPDIALIPYKDDPHPDHASGGALVERALYLAGIHGYVAGEDAAWKTPLALAYSGRREVRADVVVDTSRVHEARQRAIESHATQFGDREGARPTPLNAPDFLAVVEARDRRHGHLIGVRFGEAFQSAGPLPLANLETLATFGGKS